MDLTYPCLCCKQYKPLIYWPGSENLLCEDCSKIYYPTQKEIDADMKTYEKALQAGVL